MIQHHQESEHLDPTRPSRKAFTRHDRYVTFFFYSLPKLLKDCWVHRREWLSYPLLFGMCIPLVCFDICLEVYHRITFSLLNIPHIPRSRHIQIDRYRLPYLSWSQKIACAYCGYANGLLQYAVQIAGQTEAFFCPIRHQRRKGFLSPSHHQRFAEYGDAHGYQQRVYEFRNREKSSLKSSNAQLEIQPAHSKHKSKTQNPHSPEAM